MQKSNVITLLILVALLCGLALATYFVRTDPRDNARSDARSKLATTEAQVFTNLNGEPFSFNQFEGKVRVVNSWASWSPFSVEELRNLESLAAEYQGSVAFIAVNRKESKEVAQAFLNTVGSFSTLYVVIDQNDTYYASVGGYAMPETTFYDTDGNLVFHKRGSMDREEMRTRIEEILEAH